MINNKQQERINQFYWKGKDAEKLNRYSPCIRNCCLDDNDICLGCFRNIEEIMQWTKTSEEQKKLILQKAEVRKINKAGF